MRPRLVARRRACDAADRLHERRSGNVHGAGAVGLRQLWEVIDGQRAEVEPRCAGHHLDVLLVRTVLEREVVLGQGADDVEEQPARQDDGALALGPGFHLYTDAQLHVGGLELDLPGVGADENAGERLDGAARRHATNSDAELIQKVLTLNGELHSERPWSSRGCGQVDNGANGAMEGKVRGWSGVDKGVDCVSSGGRHEVRRSSCRRRRFTLSTTLGSTSRSAAIFLCAWRTVEWLRPPNCRPIAGRVSWVSSRARYMATWRAKATSGRRSCVSRS